MPEGLAPLLHGCAPPGGTWGCVCFLPDVFSQVPPANGHKALEQCFAGVLTSCGDAMQPNEQHSVAVLLIAPGACPLLLDGVDMRLREIPGICQLLPLTGLQMPGGQPPQHRTELLCFLPMVLLKGQALPRGVTEVPA